MAAEARDALIANAISLMEQGHPDRAEGPLRHLLRSHDDAEALALLADCMLRQGRAEDALRQLELGMPPHPGDGRLQALLARASLAAGRLLHAEVAAEKAVALEPGNADHHALLAMIHVNRGSRQPALYSADRALSLRPAHILAIKARILALRALLRRGEALEAAQAAVITHPGDADLRALLGATELDAGHWRLGRQRLREVLRAQPGNDIALKSLRESERVQHPVWRLLAGVTLQAEDWGGPVRILAVITLILMRPWELSPRDPRGLLILLPPALSIVTSYLVPLPLRLRQRDLLDQLRPPGALRPGEVAVSRAIFAAIVAAVLAAAITVWLRGAA